MTDRELWENFENYIKQHNWTFDEAAKNIGVTKASLFNWKNGRTISTRARKAMSVLIAEPMPPPDHLTNYLLEEWGILTGSEKAEVIALIESIKERKKSTTEISSVVKLA